MRRRLLLFFAVLAAGLAVAVLTVPFWLGAAAKWAGSDRGFSFGRYERIGYARFALHDVELRRAAVRVSATRVEASTPLVWAWRHWRAIPDLVVAERWLVEVGPRTPAPAPNREKGWIPLRRKLQRIAAQLDRWIPQATAGAGTVRWARGEIRLASATWRQRELEVKKLGYLDFEADAAAHFPGAEDAIGLTMRSLDEPMNLTLDSRSSAVAGKLVWMEQQAPLAARFGSRGWLPQAASIVAEDWRVPGARLRLGETYAHVIGGAKIEWDGKMFLADVLARGEPVEGKDVPPLEVAVQGHGTQQAFTIEALRATLPGVTAQLSDPVTIERSGKIRDDTAAQFTLQADLSRQPWFAATGRAEGEAKVISGGATAPVVEFWMRASDVAARDVALSRVEAQGRFDWPRLELTRGVLTAGGEGERIEVRGGWDFRRKALDDVTVNGQIRRRSVARWLPAQPDFDVVSIRARASGPIATIAHDGEARAEGLELNGLNPLAAHITWRGRAATVERFTVDAVAGTTRLRVSGDADPAGLRLQELALSRGDAPLLSLREPASLQWKPALKLDSLHLAGPDGQIDAAIEWGPAGRIEAAARNISSSWLSDLVALKGPAWRLDLFAFTGTWNQGPMKYALTAGATVDLGEERTAAVMAASRGDADGLRIEALRATEGDATVLNAVGRLPLTLRPGAAKILHIDEHGPLALDATAAPHSAFWPKLAAATGIELKEPAAELHLKGTWQKPEGSVELQAARVALDPQRFKRELPVVEALMVQLTADRDGVDLETFTVRVEGQRVSARGRLPLSDAGWADLFKQPRTVLERDADLHLVVQEAEVAVFKRFLPAVLAPKGTLTVDVKYQGRALSGTVQLRDAASRPLGPLGVLQEINADIALAGRTVTLRSLAAKAGGQPVRLSGAVEIPAGGEPRYDLALRGKNLPFVRQTGLLLRGDLDLKLQTPPAGPPRITGNVRLRDSLFLQDVRAFLPRGGGGGPARRPPYFSVDTAPLNTWTLAVEVTGEEFMRLRMPVFHGLASAHFRLSGTLGEPRAIGEVTVDEGSVRMPFATFAVKQGAVRLTEANPHEPEIYLRGTGRRYGYDLTMEVEGGASSPNVEFSASPALDSEQVLLMVMTGAAPSNEITYSGTKRVARIGAFLGQSLLGSLGADSANGERLTIASGEKISQQGKETYDIEYKLSDRWSLTGEYNEFDEYNAGLKWRVLPRKKEEGAEEAETDDTGP